MLNFFSIDKENIRNVLYRTNKFCFMINNFNGHFFIIIYLKFCMNKSVPKKTLLFVYYIDERPYRIFIQGLQKKLKH
jgi:hypothetical protein